MADDETPPDALTWDQIGLPQPAHGPVPKKVMAEALRVLVLPELAPLVRGQVALAKGISVLVMRDPDGKFRPVTSEDEIGEALEIWLKPPSTPAFKELLDRAIGRATEHVEMNHDITPGGTLAELITGSWKKREE